MSESSSPDIGTVRITFCAEGVRAFAAGIIETALATFAILIAVTQFDSSPGIKATIIGSQAFGLIGSLFLVPRIMRLSVRPSRAAAIINALSMAGFVVAALNPASEICFVAGVSIGLGVAGLAMPLQTHYLRQNYPKNSRGRLFSVNVFIRALTAMLASWLFGIYLDRDAQNYETLLWVLAAAAGLSAASQWMIPSQPFQQGAIKNRPSVMRSMKWLEQDRVFARVIVALMVMGIGVLAANALRVDYLVNPDHGLAFDVVTVSLITGIVPSITRLLSTYFWGWLFDRMNFFRLRLIVNAVFFSGIILYFSTGLIPAIIIGSALFGLARGGGEILFNLFVTKLAAPDHVAEYMTVHTFFAGLRILSAPFIGFFLVTYAGISTMMGFSLAFIAATFFILWPLLGKRTESQHA